MSLRLVSEGSPNRRSRDAPRPPAPGGGGNELVGSGDGLWAKLTADNRGEPVAKAAEECSKAALIGLGWLFLGGLYGGGATAVLTIEDDEAAER